MSHPEERDAVTHHSPEEALAAIRSLRDSDKSVLLKIAKVYARIRQTRYDHEDLLHEAITRVLEGTRKWPTAVPFMAFMAGVMRAIAWDWRAEVREGRARGSRKPGRTRCHRENRCAKTGRIVRR